MVRDKNKPHEYFVHYLEKKEHLFKAIESAMEQRTKAVDFLGENDRGITNGYKSLGLNYIFYTIAQYSAGETIEGIKETYGKTLRYAERIWEENKGYVLSLWLLSIGVLLDICDDKKALLKNIVKKYAKKDKLLWFLMEYLDKGTKEATHYLMPLPYQYLDEYIEGKRQDIKLLTKYLTDYWYDAHANLDWWYDSHKSPNNTYYGYWSFEAGAVAKILQLDDSSLKDVPYYPYDLVHYKE